MNDTGSTAQLVIGRAPVGELSIGNYLIKRLHHYGVEHCFGIPGNFVLAFYEQMHKSGLIQPVNTCDEQGSGFAAEAYARLRGLGVCCQTYGTGGLKALHTTAEAFTERSPVVVISGAPGVGERTKGKLLHPLIDGFYTQLEMYRKVTVAATVLENADSAFSEIDRVLSAALRHKRPVYIEIPRDMITVNGDREHIPSDFRMPGSNQLALSDALEEVVMRISKARQPVIWAGVELQRYGLQETFALLLEITGIPYVTSILGKALLSELHPQFIGVYQGGLSLPEVRDYVEASDCLVALGVLLTDINLGLHTAQIDPQHFIHINSSTANIEGQPIEQVQLHDLLGGLVTAGIAWRDAGDYPRPRTAPSGEAAEICLQTNSGDVIPIPEGESIAGRLPGNSIHIDEAGVSRRHASFRRQGNQVLVSDLNSSNGTFINDILLKPDRPVPLSNGDEIGLGRLLTLKIVGPLQRAPQASLEDLVDREDTQLELLSAAEDFSSGAEDTEEMAVDAPRFKAVEGEQITSARLFEAVDAYLDQQTVVAADSGETFIAGIDLLVPRINGFFAPGFFTSVGFAVPTALGAQLAYPDWRPLVLTGDAAFQMTGAELSTMVRLGLNPIVIVMNNGGYGSERPLHDSPYVDVLRWNYAKFPVVYGAGRGYTAKTEDELEFALGEARRYTESFVIIDVVLDKDDHSPAFQRFLSQSPHAED